MKENQIWLKSVINLYDYVWSTKNINYVLFPENTNEKNVKENNFFLCLVVL